MIESSAGRNDRRALGRSVGNVSCGARSKKRVQIRRRHLQQLGDIVSHFVKLLAETDDDAEMVDWPAQALQKIVQQDPAENRLRQTGVCDAKRPDRARLTHDFLLRLMTLVENYWLVSP
jgi:hypothetical protein